MAEVTYQRFSDRFFRLSPLYTWPGWYFKARRCPPIGPFVTFEIAVRAAENHVRRCCREGDSGGRCRIG